MKDTELREISLIVFSSRGVQYQHVDYAKVADLIAVKIALYIKEAGYHKVREGIPPVLSDEEINDAIEKAYTEAQHYDEKGLPIPERQIAIDQRDAGVRWGN